MYCLHRYFHLFLSKYVLLDVNFWSFHLLYFHRLFCRIFVLTGYVFSSFLRVLSFPRFRVSASTSFIAFKMSSHQMNKDKPRSGKCRHFCFPFDTHNYCPTCREAGKGDDPCVTFESPCQICGSFTQDQILKISQRKRYIKKQKALTSTSKDDELDLLGDDVESFTGSNADLESAADNLFTSPPRPKPLPFSSLSRQQRLSHPPQVLPYSRKLKLN